MAVRYAMQADGDRLFETGGFTQQIVRAPVAERSHESADELLYVLSGSGTARIAGAEHELRPGTAALVARGASWSAEGDATILSVLVHEPAGSGECACIDLGEAAEGSVARGTGTISAATGAFTDLPYTLATRVGNPEGKTSPEELLAAAHAGCLTMGLATELVQAGTPPGRLDVHCLIVMDEVPGEGHQIVGSQVTVRAEVEGVDAEALAAAVERADAGCPFSTLLRKAGVEVDVNVS